MDLMEYELYNLVDDPGQYHNIIGSHPDSMRYILVINQELQEIQTKGYQWDHQLPEASGNKRIKTDWVRV